MLMARKSPAARVCFIVFAVVIGVPAAANAHGDLHEQIESTSQRIKENPRDAGLYLRRGQLYSLHGEVEAALADFARASNLDPRLALVEFCKGEMFYQAGKDIEAKECLDRFLKSEPDHANGHAVRARTLVRLGDPKAASEDFTKAIAGVGKPELYIERAQALASDKVGDVEKALEGLNEGIRKLGPVFTLQYHALELEIKGKHFDQALKRVDEILARSIRKERWFAKRAEILAMAGRVEEARADYVRAWEAFQRLPAGRKTEPAMIDLEARLRKALRPQDGTGKGI